MRRPRTIRLADVDNRQGRIDVALYRIAERLMVRLETEQGVMGLREHALPIVEDLIRQHVPAENMIPREIQALLRVCELNRQKHLAHGQPERREP